MDTGGLSGSSSGPTPASSTNPPPTPPLTSASGGGSTRGSVATLEEEKACEVCRRKKIKCDEGQPKCSNCTKNGLECRYREAQPTKKDKTMVMILDILTRMEQTQLQHGNILSGLKTGTELDSDTGAATTTHDSTFSASSSPHTYLSQPAKKRRTSAGAAQGETRPAQSLPSSDGVNQPYRHASAAHKMLTWPAIQEILKETGMSSHGDLENVNMEGSAFIIQLCSNMPPLPADEIRDAQPFLGMQMQSNRQFGSSRVVFNALTPERMERLATSYFNTFNMLYPFMDRELFMTNVIPSVRSEGFDSDAVSIMALLVFALGEVAEDSLQEPPRYGIHRVRIGENSRERYPGIKFFNEARKRLGFVLTCCELEHVQIFALTALYLESCSYHVDFWRMTASGSSAVQVLVTCKPIIWDSPHGDLVKRAYWHSAILETGLHLELDLPLTGLLDLPDPPHSVVFGHEQSEADDFANEISHYRAHYSSQLTLRRLCAEVHDDINESMGTSIQHGKTNEYFGGPTARTLGMLEARLKFWRDKLPPPLQWPEDDPTVYPNEVDPRLVTYQRNLDPALGPHPKLFSVEPQIGQSPVFPFVYDIQVALLRTRYYYAKYMVYRPYVYKALHFPEELTPHDQEAAATCLKSCLKWPLTMSPTSRRKRLIPYLFCWSQNLLGIILIFNLSESNPALREIRDKYCGKEGSQFEKDVRESIQLMLEWIVDLKTTCPIARWCYNILKPLYNLDDFEMML